MTLDGIAAKQIRFGAFFENRNELPAEVERVLHRNVHALAGLGAVRVAGVARDEDARQARSSVLRRDIVEPVGNALANLVHREPHHVFHVERIGAQHALRGLDHLLLGVVTEGFAVVRVNLAEVHVEPHQVAALAGDQQDVAVIPGLNRGLDSNIREVGDGEHIDDAPGVIGEIAARLGADRIAHQAACAIAADNVPGADRDLRAVAHLAERDHDRVLALGFDLQGYEFQAVVCLEARR